MGKPLRLEVVLTDPELQPPEYAHVDDAGLDLRARQGGVLRPAGDRLRIPTGVKLRVPTGHVGLVCPRSGLATKSGVTVLNAPGVIDAGFRGEVEVLLVNLDPEWEFTVRRGDRIAQLLIVPLVSVEVTLVDRLTDSARGDTGFGSTGRE